MENRTPKGKILIQPQRTNNMMERFFRDYKRGQRKKTGNHSMNQTLRTMLANTPIVKNLENPQYSPERIPPAIKRLIGAPTYPQDLTQLVSAAAARKNATGFCDHEKQRQQPRL